MRYDPRELKAMASAMNPQIIKSSIFKGIKMPYKRSKETKPRKIYDLAEAALRKDVVKELKKQGFIVKRVETMAPGFPDLWASKITGGWAGWIELKTPSGRLSKEQIKFKEMCALNNINHMVVRYVDDVKNMLTNKSTNDILLLSRKEGT